MKIIHAFASAALALMAASPAMAEFRLHSPDISNGEPIKAEQYWNNFGCTGDNVRPALSWDGAPEGTKSYAVTVYDKDAPTGSGFWHWVIYNIPASITSIASDAIPQGAVEGNTDVGQPGYLGPCPPVGRKHTYTSTVHALDTDKLDAPEGATAPLTGFYIHQHSIGQATINVTAGPRS